MVTLCVDSISLAAFDAFNTQLATIHHIHVSCIPVCKSYPLLYNGVHVYIL